MKNGMLESWKNGMMVFETQYSNIPIFQYSTFNSPSSLVPHTRHSSLQEATVTSEWHLVSGFGCQARISAPET
jgi:hypothetical protein